MTSLAIARRLFDDMRAKRDAETHAHIKIDNYSQLIEGSDGQKVYKPSNTGLLFHSCDDFVRLILGPYGSGKSTTCIAEIVNRTCAMPTWSNNRRRARWALIRNTTGELQSTTLQTWLAWYDGLGDIHKRQKPILTYEHMFNDGKGIVELELLFIALDREDDVRKLKSLELTGAYINEASEVPRAVLAHLQGRVGRYPGTAFCKEKYWSGIILDTNPPSDDDWIVKEFDLEPAHGYKLFKQPPGLIESDGEWFRNPDADNAKHLPIDYYTKLAIGQTREFINVFCLGKYGTIGTGKPVFPEFNSDMHAVAQIDAIQGHSLLLGWDFGLTPRCIVAQLTPRGQLIVLKEYTGDGMGVRTFAENIVIPGLKLDFPYCKVGNSWGDPAGAARSEIMEEMSCIGELCGLGIQTLPARSNDLGTRLGAIRFFLNRMIDGKPAFVLNKSGCQGLYKGFAKDYIYDRVAVSGEERYKDKPRKNEASHSQDALQYIALEIASTQVNVEKPKLDISKIYNPGMRL